jgi:hypothetical protein
MKFTAQLNKFCLEIAPEYMAKTTKIIVNEIGSRIVERSPVGDATNWSTPAPAGYVGGRFRANWQYGMNSMPSGDLPDIDPSGQASLARIQVCTGEPGVHYIVNNLPYAQRIEDGHSRSQAPQGIVGLLEREFPQIVRLATQ